MVEYSGRTTAHEHKFDDWAKKTIRNPTPAVQQVYVFNAQWTDCPVEVEAEVKQLWRDREFGNDNYYAKWDRDDDAGWTEEDGDENKLFREKYPIIDEYLMSKGVEKCLIHWWW